MNLNYRDFLAFLDENPKIESALEISFTLVVSFVPFLFASLFAQFSEQNFSQTKYWDVFKSYFLGGEISLFVLTTCGTIIWISVVRQRSPHLFGRFLIAIFILLVAVLFVGGLIGVNPGFSKAAPDWILHTVFIIYFVTLAFWYFALLAQKSDKAPSKSSEERAKEIREAAKARKDS